MSQEGSTSLSFDSALGYPAAAVLPFSEDRVFPSDTAPFLAFEWIGLRNYLRELRLGRIGADEGRTRGQGFTSADFALRFRRLDGRIQIVLGEWKYTESYGIGQDLRRSTAGTDRWRVYQPSFAASSHFRTAPAVTGDALFYEPYYQLLRLQLLASAMQQHREMDADLVTVLHVAPRANRELRERIMAPALQGRAGSLHEIWGTVVDGECFRGIDTEDLLRSLVGHAPQASWAEYLSARYGSMQ